LRGFATWAVFVETALDMLVLPDVVLNKKLSIEKCSGHFLHISSTWILTSLAARLLSHMTLAAALAVSCEVSVDTLINLEHRMRVMVMILLPLEAYCVVLPTGKCPTTECPRSTPISLGTNMH
jgi:hypothetical protein